VTFPGPAHWTHEDPDDLPEDDENDHRAMITALRRHREFMAQVHIPLDPRGDLARPLYKPFVREISCKAPGCEEVAFISSYAERYVERQIKLWRQGWRQDPNAEKPGEHYCPRHSSA